MQSGRDELLMEPGHGFGLPVNRLLHPCCVLRYDQYCRWRAARVKLRTLAELDPLAGATVLFCRALAVPDEHKVDAELRRQDAAKKPAPRVADPKPKAKPRPMPAPSPAPAAKVVTPKERKPSPAEVERKVERKVASPAATPRQAPRSTPAVPKTVDPDINKRNVQGETGLHVAAREGVSVHRCIPPPCSAGKCELIELMVKKGAFVDIGDANGNTPLHVALQGRPSRHWTRTGCCRLTWPATTTL